MGCQLLYIQTKVAIATQNNVREIVNAQINEIHGGGAIDLIGRDIAYGNFMMWSVRNGMVGVNTTYRLAPKDPWPAGPQDVGQAIRWVHDNIAKRGGDPTRIFLFGMERL